MKRPHWEKFRNENSEFVYPDYQFVMRDRGPLKLYVNGGRHHGKIGEVAGFETGKAHLKFDDGKIAAVVYNKLEMLDADGHPMIVQMRDMMGEPIDVGAFVCYSQSTSYSHALEIGKVSKISDVGTLIIKPLVRNGKKHEQPGFGYYRADPVRKVNANRCLKLPVDPARLMMGVMTDFDSLGTDLYG